MPKQIKSVPSRFEKVNPINTMAQTEIQKAALQKYNSYGSEWEKAYFDEFSTGYNVYHKDHKFTEVGGGGEAEIIVGKALAKYNGKQVEFLPERWKKQPDIRFDDKTWDIKYIDHANEETIRAAIRDARKADNAIFYWNINEKLDDLRNAIIREVGRMSKNNRINEMPDIYYIDKAGLLRTAWKK